MIEAIEKHLEPFDEVTRQRFKLLSALIHESTTHEIREDLWARIPSYYCGRCFVRLIPFRDHINIEASALSAHRDELPGCRFTPNGMLQLGHQQEIPAQVLERVFRESLEP